MKPDGRADVSDAEVRAIEARALGAMAVVRRLRDGWSWPLPERADGFRYWARIAPPGWGVVTDDERKAIEEVEADGE